MKVREIMNRKVVSVSPETGAREALGLLLKMKISGLPVIDEKNELVGMFTEKEVLAAILPSYVGKVGRFIYQENPKSIKKKLQDLVNLPVSQLMHKNVVTVDEDASLCEVARLMLVQSARRILVLDKEKKVMGIVAREDIVKAYTKEAGWEID